MVPDFHAKCLHECARAHITSRLAFCGYEVVYPSHGKVELVVLNSMRVVELGEPPVYTELALRTAVLEDGSAVFSVGLEEMEVLCQGEQRYTSFVIFHDLVRSYDPDSFNAGPPPGPLEAPDESAMGLEADSFGISMFWLHSSQMTRARRDGFWKPRWGWEPRWDGDDFLLHVQLDEGSLSIEDIRLLPEQYCITNIVDRCASDAFLRLGNFLEKHVVRD